MVRARLAAALLTGALALTGCHGASALQRAEDAARRSGLPCWVEREANGESGVYCGDANLAPEGARFLR